MVECIQLLMYPEVEHVVRSYWLLMIREKVVLLRCYMTQMNAFEAMEFLLKQIKGTKTNEDFLISMNK